MYTQAFSILYCGVDISHLETPLLRAILSLYSQMPQQILPLLKFLTLSWWHRDFSRTLGLRAPLSPPGPLVFLAFLPSVLPESREGIVFYVVSAIRRYRARSSCAMPLSLGWWPQEDDCMVSLSVTFSFGFCCYFCLFVCLFSEIWPLFVVPTLLELIM